MAEPSEKQSREESLTGPESGDADSKQPEPTVWTSEALFGEDVEVMIQHGEMVYRLRRTRNGKLILYK